MNLLSPYIPRHLRRPDQQNKSSNLLHNGNNLCRLRNVVHIPHNANSTVSGLAVIGLLLAKATTDKPWPCQGAVAGFHIASRRRD